MSFLRKIRLVRPIWIIIPLVLIGLTGIPESFADEILLFNDDYSSSNGWEQIGSKVTVDDTLFSNVVKFNNAFGGQPQGTNRVYKDMQTTLPETWIANFYYIFTDSSIPFFVPFGLTATSEKT